MSGVRALCVTTTRVLRRVLGKIFVMELSCHSNDVDAFSWLLDCALGGFPPPFYSVVKIHQVPGVNVTMLCGKVRGGEGAAHGHLQEGVEVSLKVACLQCLLHNAPHIPPLLLHAADVRVQVRQRRHGSQRVDELM